MALTLLSGCSGNSGTGTPGKAKVGLKVVFANASSASTAATMQSLGIVSLLLDVIPANPAITVPNSTIDLEATTGLSTTINLPDPVSPALSEPYLFRITAFSAGNKIIYCGQTRVNIQAGNNTINLMTFPLNGFEAAAGDYSGSASDGTILSLTFDTFGKGTGTTSAGSTLTAYLAPTASGIFDVTVAAVSPGNTLNAYGSGSFNPATNSGSGTVTDDLGAQPTWTVTKVTPTATTPTAPSTVFSQADLTGTWNVIQFHTGPDVSIGTTPGWMTGNATISSTGDITFNSILRSDGPGSVTGTMNWTVDSTGRISETGTAAFALAPPLQMSSNKQIVVGVASSSQNRILRVAVKQVGTFSNADITGPANFVSSDINSGIFTDWDFTQGTIDANSLVTQTSSIDPNGSNTVGSIGTLQIDSVGKVAMLGLPNFHGIMTPDKKLIFAVNTSTQAANGYGFVVISIEGQTFTQADLAGTWTVFSVANDNPFVWEYTNALFSNTGLISVTSYLNSSGDNSTAGQGGNTLNIGPTGLITEVQDASVHGFQSADKKLSVVTSTWSPGVFSMNLFVK